MGSRSNLTRSNGKQVTSMKSRRHFAPPKVGAFYSICLFVTEGLGSSHQQAVIRTDENVTTPTLDDHGRSSTSDAGIYNCQVDGSTWKKWDRHFQQECSFNNVMPLHLMSYVH